MSLKDRIKQKLSAGRVKVVDLWGEKVGVRLLSVKDFKDVSFTESDKAAEFLSRQFVDPEDGSQVVEAGDITTANFKELVDIFMDANTAGGKDAEKNSNPPQQG